MSLEVDRKYVSFINPSTSPPPPAHLGLGYESPPAYAIPIYSPPFIFTDLKAYDGDKITVFRTKGQVSIYLHDPVVFDNGDDVLIVCDLLG